MLNLLRVRDLAIIEDLEVELGPGLNVLTGETGAGKSILVAALKLVLGARGRGDLVRTGAPSAEVEALFDVRGDAAIAQRLATEGIDAEAELVVRRTVGADGPSRAWVNGRLATAGQLARLAQGLVDISSQHEHQTLVDASTHLDYLDAFGGLGPAREVVAQGHRVVVEATRALDEARRQLQERGAREDLLRFQLDEIERLAPVPGEDESLAQEVPRLRYGEQIVVAARDAAGALYDEDGSVCDRLGSTIASLRDAARHDPRLDELAARVDAARTDLQEAARDLESIAEEVLFDPDRLAEVEERLHVLRRLVRKHGVDLSGVLTWRDSAADELSRLDDADSRVDACERARDRALREVAARASALSEARRAAADRLGAAITAELHGLGMGGARVEVEVARLDGPSDIACDGARLTSTGIDRVEFLIAPNPGEEPRPLKRVASGGELSRALLALKRVLAGLGPVGLYVFDEVDAGVGGAVAEVIGRKLAEVARHHQVLCITHLPQVAVFADQHLRVSKAVASGRTRTTVERLDAAERAEEISRMLGGLEITAATRSAAADLLRAART